MRQPRANSLPTRALFLSRSMLLPGLLFALCPRAARAAELPPTGVIAQLHAFDPRTGSVSALLQAVVPRLALLYLKVAPTQEIDRGGPFSHAFSAESLARLDNSPGSLPIVVYKKEDGRLPAGFIMARYRGVLPEQMYLRMGSRDLVIKHPLVRHYDELVRAQADAPGWGPQVTRSVSTAFYAVDMPFGAGLFGLRDSYILGEWEYIKLPNGIAIASYINRPATPDERRRYGVFRDKKDKERRLDEDYHEGREYRLTSLLIPERDAGGKVANTVQVYFVRIVPALKPGTDLKGSGALARWIFARGAQEALITPVKMARDEVERQLAARKGQR